MGKTLLRVVMILVVGAAAAGGIYVYKTGQKDAAAGRLLEELIADLGAIEVDEAGWAYLEGLARRYHDEVAGEAFDSRGRPTGGTFDVNRYQLMMVERMSAHAGRDGADEIVVKLEKFKATARLELVAPVTLPVK